MYLLADSLGQWLSTGVPREMLLNIENGVFGEVAEVVVFVKCVGVS